MSNVAAEQKNFLLAAGSPIAVAASRLQQSADLGRHQHRSDGPQAPPPLPPVFFNNHRHQQQQKATSQAQHQQNTSAHQTLVQYKQTNNDNAHPFLPVVNFSAAGALPPMDASPCPSSHAAVNANFSTKISFNAATISNKCGTSSGASDKQNFNTKISNERTTHALDTNTSTKCLNLNFLQNGGFFSRGTDFFVPRVSASNWDPSGSIDHRLAACDQPSTSPWRATNPAAGTPAGRLFSAEPSTSTSVEGVTGVWAEVSSHSAPCTPKSLTSTTGAVDDATPSMTSLTSLSSSCDDVLSSSSHEMAKRPRALLAEKLKRTRRLRSDQEDKKDAVGEILPTRQCHHSSPNSPVDFNGRTVQNFAPALDKVKNTTLNSKRGFLNGFYVDSAVGLLAPPVNIAENDVRSAGSRNTAARNNNGEVTTALCNGGEGRRKILPTHAAGLRKAADFSRNPPLNIDSSPPIFDSATKNSGISPFNPNELYSDPNVRIDPPSNVVVKRRRGCPTTPLDQRQRPAPFDVAGSNNGGHDQRNTTPMESLDDSVDQRWTTLSNGSVPNTLFASQFVASSVAAPFSGGGRFFAPPPSKISNRSPSSSNCFRDVATVLPSFGDYVAIETATSSSSHKPPQPPFFVVDGVAVPGTSFVDAQHATVLPSFDFAATSPTSRDTAVAPPCFVSSFNGVADTTAASRPSTNLPLGNALGQALALPSFDGSVFHSSEKRSIVRSLENVDGRCWFNATSDDRSTEQQASSVHSSETPTTESGDPFENICNAVLANCLRQSVETPDNRLNGGTPLPPVAVRTAAPKAPPASRAPSIPKAPPAMCTFTGSLTLGDNSETSLKAVCRQRCVNSYKFCIRHILSDPNAPYKACAYIKSAGCKEMPCNNAVLQQVDVECDAAVTKYCGTHLIKMGYRQAKTKKNKPPCAANVESCSSNDQEISKSGSASISMENNVEQLTTVKSKSKRRSVKKPPNTATQDRDRIFEPNPSNPGTTTDINVNGTEMSYLILSSPTTDGSHVTMLNNGSDFYDYGSATPTSIILTNQTLTPDQQHYAVVDQVASMQQQFMMQRTATSYATPHCTLNIDPTMGSVTNGPSHVDHSAGHVTSSRPESRMSASSAVVCTSNGYGSPASPWKTAGNFYGQSSTTIDLAHSSPKFSSAANQKRAAQQNNVAPIFSAAPSKNQLDQSETITLFNIPEHTTTLFDPEICENFKGAGLRTVNLMGNNVVGGVINFSLFPNNGIHTMTTVAPSTSDPSHRQLLVGSDDFFLGTPPPSYGSLVNMVPYAINNNVTLINGSSLLSPVPSELSVESVGSHSSYTHQSMTPQQPIIGVQHQHATTPTVLVQHQTSHVSQAPPTPGHAPSPFTNSGTAPAVRVESSMDQTQLNRYTPSHVQYPPEQQVHYAAPPGHQKAVVVQQSGGQPISVVQTAFSSPSSTNHRPPLKLFAVTSSACSPVGGISSASLQRAAVTHQLLMTSSPDPSLTNHNRPYAFNILMTSSSPSAGQNAAPSVMTSSPATSVSRFLSIGQPSFCGRRQEFDGRVVKIEEAAATGALQNPSIFPNSDVVREPMPADTLSAKQSPNGAPPPAKNPPSTPSSKPKKVIRLKPKKRRQKMAGKYRQIPAVAHMCRVVDDLAFDKTDLFPLGLEPSSSDSESDDDLRSPLSAFIKTSFQLDYSHEDSQRDKGICPSTFSAARRQLYLLRRTLEMSHRDLKRKAVEIKAISGACKFYPNSCGQAFRDLTLANNPKRRRRLGRATSTNELQQYSHLGVLPRRCAHASLVASPSTVAQSSGDPPNAAPTPPSIRCTGKCLPYATMCPKHILKVPDQTLFRKCVAQHSAPLLPSKMSSTEPSVLDEPSSCPWPALVLGVDAPTPICAFHQDKTWFRNLGKTGWQPFGSENFSQKEKRKGKNRYVKKNQKRKRKKINSLGPYSDRGMTGGREFTLTPEDGESSDGGGVDEEFSNQDAQAALASVVRDFGFGSYDFTDILVRLPDATLIDNILGQEDAPRNQDQTIIPAAHHQATNVTVSVVPQQRPLPPAVASSSAPLPSAARHSNNREEMETIERALTVAAAGDHNWADVEQFLMEENCRNDVIPDPSKNSALYRAFNNHAPSSPAPQYFALKPVVQSASSPGGWSTNRNATMTMPPCTSSSLIGRRLGACLTAAANQTLAPPIKSSVCCPTIVARQNVTSAMGAAAPSLAILHETPHPSNQGAAPPHGTPLISRLEPPSTNQSNIARGSLTFGRFESPTLNQCFAPVRDSSMIGRFEMRPSNEKQDPTSHPPSDDGRTSVDGRPPAAKKRRQSSTKRKN